MRTISLKTFTRRERERILGKQVPASSLQDSETSLKPRKTDVSTYSQIAKNSNPSSDAGGYSEIASVSSGGYDEEILTIDVKTGKRYEPTGSLKDTPFVLLRPIKEVKEIEFCLKFLKLYVRLLTLMFTEDTCMYIYCL